MDRRVGDIRRSRIIFFHGLGAVIAFLGALIYSSDARNSRYAAAIAVLIIEAVFLGSALMFSSSNPFYRVLAKLVDRWNALGYFQGLALMPIGMVSMLVFLSLTRFGCTRFNADNPAFADGAMSVVGAAGTFVSLVFVIVSGGIFFDETHAARKQKEASAEPSA